MDALEAYELPQHLVFVDLETTGGSAAHHRIIEVGIVRVERDAAVEEWSSLVNPGCPIPSDIERFTGITNEMVESAPCFADIAKLVLEKLGPSGGSPAVFVAHNARFDYAFLRAEFRRLELPFSAKVLCTVKLSRRLYPQGSRHNLDAVMERHDLACSARHRALGDARVIKDFWLKLQRELPAARLAAAVQSALGSHRLPAHVPEGLEDELPEGPGVYRFYGADGVPLYVGRSACLKSAVLGHFADGRHGGHGQELKDAVRHIEWVETAGELGASLRELAYLKTLQPLYNRRVKPASDSFTIRIAAGTGAAEIAAIDEVDPAQLPSCFGLFHSSKDASKALSDIARARALCLTVLGLEPSDGSCLAYQIGGCKGACVGKEPLGLHAVRVQMALASLKLKPWPFPGRVALAERQPFGGADYHVLDGWTYLGTARCEEELAELAARKAPAAFDAHVYRILNRYLAHHRPLDWHPLRLAEGLSG
ncbi:MAG TPA: exonuclease domain-containing protein [Steroidobacteraceae bacterium]|nr:exonuclease domain-containing protein [Steroidobacteraceae bacterium]